VGARLTVKARTQSPAELLARPSVRLLVSERRGDGIPEMVAHTYPVRIRPMGEVKKAV
jgi:hypothetical protein